MVFTSDTCGKSSALRDFHQNIYHQTFLLFILLQTLEDKVLNKISHLKFYRYDCFLTLIIFDYQCDQGRMEIFDEWLKMEKKINENLKIFDN